ncbi:MAG: heme-binding protein [Zetaproteobacteria bacterium]|nr:MAG: heme-binding protein [Zetaproteobacteria bacterium]
MIYFQYVGCNNLKHYIKFILVSAVMFSGFFLSPDCQAETLLTQKVLSSTAANRAVLAAVAACGKNGYKVSAAVVDKSGVIQAQLRGDGAGVHTIDSSRRKAYTAVSMGSPTQVFAELVSERPNLHALGDMNDSILLLGGGFPVKIDGQIVGGIGVGGAPGAHLDEACARAGLKALGADLYQ